MDRDIGHNTPRILSKQSSIVRFLAKLICPVFRAGWFKVVGLFLGFQVMQPRQRNARSK
jgi:hypothetical protein